MKNKKNILIIFGTRPEAIKMAPLVHAFKVEESFNTKVLVTAQHREMLDQVLQLFEITPDYDLNLMKPGQTLSDVHCNVLKGVESIILESKPDYMFVHGDTATSTAAAQAGFYHQIPVAHIEAGLRTGNMYSPFPEEINRKLTAQMATYHFAPTELAKDNLLKENNTQSIVVTGNTVIDALQWVMEKIKREKIQYPELKGINLDEKIVLITGHRRENFGEGFLNICHAIKVLAEKNGDSTFIYPVHLNPNVRKPVNEILTGIENIKLIEPLTYEPFIALMSSSYLVLTDSGGIQEEAPGLGKPVLVMRDTTERPEAVKAGTVRLVGTDKNAIITHVQELMDSREKYDLMAQAKNPYGDGKASSRIVSFFKSLQRVDV
ncbi:MAG: UDP-N-acetylglucosamine 2-epimerase (non-hydrolyzing) [Spirochaetaceae bacterium 4572_59]|nr:MAG: UDP-N-acetylglucosamine 2-epimerase (non-hydrolyzing) [Spirochaetaceae bacterium 4572_59]